LIGVIGYVALAPSTDDGTAATPVTRATTPTTKTVTPTDVYQTILPSLVYVSAKRADTAGRNVTVVGSGVIVNASGQILTANHVVQGASNIQVTFADGTVSSAAISSSQPSNDIATLQPDHGPTVVVPAVLGGGAKVGDVTYAIGNPLGLAASFSAGVISGLDRAVALGDGVGMLHGLIQFDAAVNPGSSGGPLLNRTGQVIGIVTGLANATGQDLFVGIGFAVPIATAGGAAGAPNQ
jgi:S1-C subfamily serine protease